MSENCVEILGKKARQAEKFLNTVSQNLKNDALLSIADALVKNTEFILSENKKDVENAQANGISKAMCDRLALTSERIKGIADGVKKVADLQQVTGSQSVFRFFAFLLMI